MTPRSPSTGSAARMRSVARRRALNVPIRFTVTTLVKSAQWDDALLADHPAGRADAGAVDQAPESARGRRRRPAPRRPGSRRSRRPARDCRAPMPATACRRGAGGRSQDHDLARPPGQRLAVARPRPEAPPVTTADAVRDVHAADPAAARCPCRAGGDVPFAVRADRFRAQKWSARTEEGSRQTGDVSDAPVSAALFNVRGAHARGVNSPCGPSAPSGAHAVHGQRLAGPTSSTPTAALRRPRLVVAAR